MQQGFAQQRNAVATLSDDTKGLADKVNRMGNAFEKEVQRLETKQNRQFNALDAQLSKWRWQWGYSHSQLHRSKHPPTVVCLPIILPRQPWRVICDWPLSWRQ